MAILSPYPKFRAFDQNAWPLAGGKLHTYEAGTLTPKATFTTAAGTAPNTNPIILDAQGEADVWLDGVYRWVLTDANDVQIWDIDQIGNTVGGVLVRTNATTRTLTAGAGTPQVLQSDLIPANAMIPTRVLAFEYFGLMSTQSLDNITLRVKYDSTELWSTTVNKQQPTMYAWRLTGTILMRTTSDAQMIAQFNHAATAPGEIFDLTQKAVTQNLSQSFALVLEVERNTVNQNELTLYGSSVTISG